MQRVTVLGGGSFGTALAELSARVGLVTRLWLRNRERAEVMQKERRNPQYLKEVVLSPFIDITADLHAALADADWVIVAVPSQAVRETMLAARAAGLRDQPLVLAAKGIENDTLMTMDEVVQDVLGAGARERVLAMSGPSFAREILLGHPTAVVLASRDEDLAQRISKLLFSDTFRAYTSTDIVGVEMGGALKNVIALAVGGAVGMGLGYNSQAALITRGLAEMTRLAVAKGGTPLTLAGLSGLGDLVLTCTGGLSRNRQVGQLLGEGKTLELALAQVQEVVEGVRTTASAHALAQRLGVDAPITAAVFSVLYEHRPVRQALLSLVRREPGREHTYA